MNISLDARGRATSGMAIYQKAERGRFQRDDVCSFRESTLELLCGNLITAGKSTWRGTPTGRYQESLGSTSVNIGGPGPRWL